MILSKISILLGSFPAAGCATGRYIKALPLLPSFQGFPALHAGRSASSVLFSQCCMLASTPSSIGRASSNKSTMALKRGMPTMEKKPSWERVIPPCCVRSISGLTVKPAARSWSPCTQSPLCCNGPSSMHLDLLRVYLVQHACLCSRRPRC